MAELADHRKQRAAAFSETWEALNRSSRAHVESRAALPVGMTAGKTAAIVAGVGLLAAGAYALLRKKEEIALEGPPESWVDRVTRQRAHAATLRDR